MARGCPASAKQRRSRHESRHREPAQSIKRRTAVRIGATTETYCSGYSEAKKDTFIENLTDLEQLNGGRDLTV
jgi:hypothetical protein